MVADRDVKIWTILWGKIPVVGVRRIERQNEYRDVVVHRHDLRLKKVKQVQKTVCTGCE